MKKKVGLISPSGLLYDKININKGIKYLESLGYEVVVGKHVYDTYRYMAGTPQDRAQDIMDFYKDPDIKAIFSTRGGAGSQYVLDHLDYEIIKKNPKPLVGFSDTTALQLAIYTKTKNINYSGFLINSDFREDELNPVIDQSLRQVLKGEKQKIISGETVNSGKAEGVLIGGCLSLINYLCGTEYYPDLSGKILLLEDIGEKTYVVDAKLKQLRQNPNFDKLKAIIFGEFIDCETKCPEDGTIGDIIKDFAEEVKIPIIQNFLYRHSKSRYILPIGAKAKLNADTCTLEC